VYAAVTALRPDSTLDELAASQKYGRLLQMSEGVYLFEEDRPERLQWRITFDPPRRRVMDAVNPKWADREDTFSEAPGGTAWTVTWHTRARGAGAALQWLVFQIGGKARVMREVIAPVVSRFPTS
jgi:hypothetical protein